LQVEGHSMTGWGVGNRWSA